MIQDVMISGYLEYGNVLYTEGCLNYSTDAAELSKVLIAKCKHDVGRYFLSQAKRH